MRRWHAPPPRDWRRQGCTSCSTGVSPATMVGWRSARRCLRFESCASAGSEEKATMCLGIPGQVVEFLDDAQQLAKVDVGSVRRSVHVGLLVPEGLDVGDWVLIHVGFAISKIDEDEALRTIAFLRSLGEQYEQE